MIEEGRFELKGSNAYWLLSSQYNDTANLVFRLDCEFPGILKFDYHKDSCFDVCVSKIKQSNSDKAFYPEKIFMLVLYSVLES